MGGAPVGPLDLAAPRARVVGASGTVHPWGVGPPGPGFWVGKGFFPPRGGEPDVPGPNPAPPPKGEGLAALGARGPDSGRRVVTPALAAIALEAAREQDETKYWEMLELLFERQPDGLRTLVHVVSGILYPQLVVRIRTGVMREQLVENRGENEQVADGVN